MAGDRIESFELEEAIGAGGMGAVFRALDTRLDRHVALKILPPEQAIDPEVVQRFYQEGRAAARLDHENIARVYTIDHDQKYHFIAFEYIEGTTIRQRVERNGPLPIDEAINFTLQIAGALVHAAERGVVHRDIKPSNIIVTPHGRAKLVDMGLARSFERGSDDGLTQSGMTLGTFDYISPEQARDPRDVDVRSDLYSLGCTLFHMLTGRPPFPEGTVLQKLLQHQEDTPPDVRSLNPAVPTDLANILVKLMAKDPDRRYQTPEQLVRDLLTVAGALGLRSVSPEGLTWMAASHTPTWERHLVWGVPTLALALVVAGLVWVGQDTDSQRGRPFIPENYAKAATPVASPTGKVAEPGGANLAVTTPPAPVVTKTQTGQTRSSAPRERMVDSTEDLLAVLAELPPRSVVVLSDDGPYEIGRNRSSRALTRLVQRDLVLKADAGVHPVLTFSREPGLAGKPPPALLDFQGGHIMIEGLEFAAEPPDRGDSWASIRTEDTELTLRRCVFRWPAGRGRSDRVSAVQVRVTGTENRAPATQADACHFDGGGQVGIHAQGAAEVSLRDCTFGVAEPAIWFDNPKADSLVPADLWLRHVSAFASEGGILRVEGTALRVRAEDSVFAPIRDTASGTLLACDSPDDLEWRGRANLYSRISTFLQPIGSQSQREPIRGWSAWSDSPATARESGSSYVPTRVWEEADPQLYLAQAEENPSRAFHLASLLPKTRDLGARQGPFGTLISHDSSVAKSTLAQRENPPSTSIPAERGSPASREVATSPVITPPQPTSDTAIAKANDVAKMPEMPVMPPMDPQEAFEPTASSPVNDKAQGQGSENLAARTTDSQVDPEVLRTAEQFLNALKQTDPHHGVLRIAADADWELPGQVLDGGIRRVVRAEPGSKRPRIRFRPPPTDPKMPTAWSVWIELRSGVLQLEGIDLVLSQADAPRQGRWGAFAVWSGADLNLSDCTVTIEGRDAQSALIVISSLEPGREEKQGLESSAALVKLSDSLIRGGGDLADVYPGRRLDLELADAVIALGGSLLHAHGSPRDQAPETMKLTLSQVTAKVAGGLVLLESAPEEPELPVADVRVRDSILATTPQGAPLFRVDGQGTLAALRDRIKWEGHGVAYHEINAYRRDQSSQVGSIPNIYDRPSWMVAVGTKEASPIHDDVKFARKWEPEREPWTLTRSDVELASESPALRAGADLQQVPDAPASSPSSR
ncbi:serine/threonine-protein kinase [Singulisphaera sp. PoT]|uniref:serine/threonine-protein kinase n=1 Tax=Singulisphaera sp. PoT TaxID=3411797 RepID=UPI003BF4F8D8